NQREYSGEADLFCQFAASRYFRRLTLPDSAAGEVPLDPIRRAHQQQRLTDVDSHKCPFMLLVPQSPPDADKRETDTVGAVRQAASRSVERRDCPRSDMDQ